MTCFCPRGNIDHHSTTSAKFAYISQLVNVAQIGGATSILGFAEKNTLYRYERAAKLTEKSQVPSHSTHVFVLKINNDP